MSVFKELKRRNVLRVGAAYIVTAWLIVQVAETLFPIYGLSDSAIRLVVNILAVGLVPVLVLAWVFEWTPQGLKRDTEVDHSTAPSLEAAKRLDRIILVVLALALGYFAFDKFVLAPQQRAKEVAEARESGRSEALIESFGDQSIAVLAFADLSPDSDQAYFSDGVSEEILNLLAAIPELRVISRSSAFTYKGKDVPIPQIAQELNVAHVLEGSVRKAGNRIRITAQLIEGRTDTHLWSQTWDRTLEDIFAIQDEVAADVVENLQVQLIGAVPTSRRTDPEVYALTLQAKREMEFRAEGFEQRTGELLERALEIDPEYLPALEAMLWHEFQFLGETESRARYHIWRDRILAVDPNNGTIQSYDAWDRFTIDRDIEGAIQAYQQLITNQPNNPEVLRLVGAFLRRIGKFEQAIPVMQQCMRIDPLKVNCIWQLKEIHLFAGNLELAREYMQRMRVIWNDPVRSHDVLLLMLLKDYDAAAAMLESWAMNWQTSVFLAMEAHARGDMETYERELETFLASDDIRQGHPHALGWAATLAAFVGDRDAAFGWLDRWAEADVNDAMINVFTPGLLPLRDDARWFEYRKRLGMSQERLDAIRFEVPARFPKAEERLGLP